MKARKFVLRVLGLILLVVDGIRSQDEEVVLGSDGIQTRIRTTPTPDPTVEEFETLMTPEAVPTTITESANDPESTAEQTAEEQEAEPSETVRPEAGREESEDEQTRAPSDVTKEALPDSAPPEEPGSEATTSDQEQEQEQEDEVNESSGDEEEDEILIDPFTPQSSITWLAPVLPLRGQIQNIFPTGSNYTAKWEYTHPVLIPPTNITLFRNNLPKSNPPARPWEWKEIVTLPWDEELLEYEVYFEPSMIAGSNYYFKLEANYPDPDTLRIRPQGRLVTLITPTSAPMGIYHPSYGDVPVKDSAASQSYSGLLLAATFVVATMLL